MQEYSSVLKQLKRDEDAEKIVAQVNTLRGGETAPDVSSATKEAASNPPSETVEKSATETK